MKPLSCNVYVAMKLLWDSARTNQLLVMDDYRHLASSKVTGREHWKLASPFSLGALGGRAKSVGGRLRVGRGDLLRG